MARGNAFASERQAITELTGIVSAAAFGAIGNGVADDTTALQAALDSCFGTASSPRASDATKRLYVPAGLYKITQPLSVRSLVGGRVFGAGRLATRIRNTQGSVFKTNGCAYTHFSDMTFWAGADGVGFDLDWDNTGSVSLQSNTFTNIDFSGGAIGCRIGHTGFMGSENQFFNCSWHGCSEAGLRTENFNALQNGVFGGNFQGCKHGIYIAQGSVPTISNVGFQISSEWDIYALEGANDTMVISGCRSESANFLRIYYHTAVISGCSQTGPDGYFIISVNQPQSIIGCISANGKVYMEEGGIIDSSQFGRDDWIDRLAYRVYTTKLRTGKTYAMVGSGTPANYERGYWFNAAFTEA